MLRLSSQPRLSPLPSSACELSLGPHRCGYSLHNAPIPPYAAAVFYGEGEWRDFQGCCMRTRRHPIIGQAKLWSAPLAKGVWVHK